MVHGQLSGGKALVNGLVTRWTAYRARRAWNGLATRSPRQVTATFDAGDWNAYWASGMRDLESVLDVAFRGGLVARERAVDIGCGMGRITRVLADHFDDVVGLDIAVDMLRHARSASARPNITYALVGPGSTLPLDTGAADLVMAWTVFRHVSEDVFTAYVKEAHRVLKPQGILVFEAQVRDSGPVVRSRTHKPFPEREYTLAELRHHCSSGGFTWTADGEQSSATPGTVTLVMAWRKR